ncbi:MAG: putative inorganic carbon transporter subunit DabA [Variovorax sp.]
MHDYRWQQDVGFKVLELIMTAPMIVTYWINLQNYASTVDNQRYGSGNKVLHNVVGGNIGVFEGNSGDLRVGLPMQSLHDGEALRHAPLRLSVFIEAPQNPIDAFVGRHDNVSRLLNHQWMHLFRIGNDSDSDIWRYLPGGPWERLPKAPLDLDVTSRL